MFLQSISRKIIISVLILLALIPIILTTYQVVFSQNNSIEFLGDYSPKIKLLVISYYIILLGFGIFWFTNQLISLKNLKNEKARTELMILKSQVNPHFFFNMLNNLYGLVAKDSKKAQELILKLSDLMRYSIYEGEKDMVSLKEELTYLKNYMELHKMRYHKNIDIQFQTEADETMSITPLLYIILVENAFKHGVENLRENAYIKINLTSLGNKLNFTIRNNYDSSINPENIDGIGLKNLRRRLELIYPDHHEFSIERTSNQFTVRLNLHQS